MHVVGLDIGGANLKAADTDRRVALRPFAVWKAPERLADELAALLADFPKPDCLAVTMTAELADCYRTKAEGVDSILQAVEQAAGCWEDQGAQSSDQESGDSRRQEKLSTVNCQLRTQQLRPPAYVWQTGAEFVPPQVAREIPRLVAAANWHALATWTGRLAPEEAALLIDVGSTTTDIVPLLDGVPVPDGLTDLDRLQSGELVYTGVRRTPVCAVAHSVPLAEGYCPLAAELFATTLDVYLLLGLTAEDADDTETADGQPATIEAARDRLSRMLCCDREEIDRDDLPVIARFLSGVQKQRITGAVDRVLKNADRECSHVLVSGSGAFLAEQVVGEHRRLSQARLTRLSDYFTPAASQAACALAVARLADERLAGGV